jgi:glucose-6-phosphate 1-dehydrogenase
VEAQWRAVDPILGNVTPVHSCEPGTWGPDEADQLIASDAAWVNPTVQEENEKELEK